MPRPTPLRRDLACVYANAALWAFGNGLVSTTLVVYLALQLGAPGSAIGLIVAAPRFAGVLRVVAPVLAAVLRRRKALCLTFLSASGLVLIAMPLLASPNYWEPAASALVAPGVAVLVVTWCLYHLLEYCGVVLLWAWLGDLMPPRVRGRLIGLRESCMMIGGVLGILASFSVVSFLRQRNPAPERWEPLSWSAMLGAVAILASIVPLVLLSARESNAARIPRSPWRGMLDSFKSRPYRRLLAFSCGLSIANGITATAHALYPQRVLGVSFEAMLGLRSMMRSGQAAAAPLAGRWLDRHGARGMMMAAQAVVATGPLFFFLASPDAKWWIAAAYVAWIAYAATNVGLDHLKLTLAPSATAAPSLAVYYAVGDLANGIMTVVGGVLYDRLTAEGADVMTLYAGLFLTGWLARSAVIALAARLIEPAEAA